MTKNHKVAIIISSLILALTSSLLWFKISLTSDSLFLDSLAKDLFEQSGRWSHWKLTPAPAYFPDMLLYFFSYKILPNAYSRIFFVSVAQVFILALSVTWTAKQIYPKISGATLAALLLLIAFTTVVASKSEMWLYFYSTNNHFASLVVPLICLGLIIRFYTKPSFIAASILILAGAIAKASTVIYLIGFLVPAIVLTLLVLFVAVNSPRQHGIYINRICWILCILVASFVISLPLEMMLTFNKPLDGRVMRTLESAGSSLNLFLQATIDAFSFKNKLTFILSTLIFASLLFLIYRLVRKITFRKKGVFITLDSSDDVPDDCWRIAVCNALLFTVIPINISGAVLSGGIVYVFGYRYLSFPIALTLILTAIIGDKINLFSFRQRKFGFIVICMTLIFLSVYVFRANRSMESHPQTIARCLVNIEKNGFKLNEGMADYWGARGVSEYLPRKNWIIATTNDLMAMSWMTSIGPIRSPNNYHYKYNFAILNSKDNPGPFDYTPLTIGKLLPPPSQVYDCIEGKAKIWLYNDGKLNAALENTFNRTMWSNKSLNKYLADYFTEGQYLPGITGSVVGLARSAVASKDKAGFLNFGPYIYLDRGRYKISIKYSTTGPTKSTIGYVEMGQFNTPRVNLLYKEVIKANSVGYVTALITIPVSGISKFEVRTWFSGVGSIAVESLKVSKLKDNKG